MHEVDDVGEERLVCQMRVMLFEQGMRGGEHFASLDAQTETFKLSDYLADEIFLNAIGFQQNDRCFHMQI